MCREVLPHLTWVLMGTTKQNRLLVNWFGPEKKRLKGRGDLWTGWMVWLHGWQVGLTCGQEERLEKKGKDQQDMHTFPSLAPWGLGSELSLGCSVHQWNFLPSCSVRHSFPIFLPHLHWWSFRMPPNTSRGGGKDREGRPWTTVNRELGSSLETCWHLRPASD